MFFTTLRIVIIVANLSMLLIVVVWIWLDSVHSVCWNGFVVWWSSEQVNHIYTIIMYRISYFVARSHWHRVILVILWHDLPWGATRHCSISLSLSPVLNCATWKEVPREIRQLYLQVCNNDYIYIYTYMNIIATLDPEGTFHLADWSPEIPILRWNGRDFDWSKLLQLWAKPR